MLCRRSSCVWMVVALGACDSAIESARHAPPATATHAPATAAEVATASAAPAPAPSPDVSATAAASEEPVADEPSDIATCVPSAPPKGYEHCSPLEAVGGSPCELECERPRTLQPKDPCCEDPVHVALFGANGTLLELDTCGFVSPECFDKGRGKLPARELHVVGGAVPEIIVVEGGCEMRAMAHGYVPSGVAAWTGCGEKFRFRWNGTRFSRVK